MCLCDSQCTLIIRSFLAFPQSSFFRVYLLGPPSRLRSGKPSVIHRMISEEGLVRQRQLLPILEQEDPSVFRSSFVDLKKIWACSKETNSNIVISTLILKLKKGGKVTLSMSGIALTWKILIPPSEQAYDAHQGKYWHARAGVARLALILTLPHFIWTRTLSLDQYPYYYK